MHFTQEDYKKIENWLLRNSVKDSEFQDALPLNGSETIVITQNGHNRNMTVQELSNKVLELGVSDFINVSDNFDTYGIDLMEAITLIPTYLRKKGVVITFCNKENNWEIYQFTGVLNQWNNVTLWNDIFNIERYAVNSLLPDEEDTTRTEIDKNGNSYLKLKDKEYNPLEFSGYGKKTLRKKIVTVKTSPKESKRINILEGSVFKDSNTVYEIKYDFDLNNSTVTLPENCILLFNGGKISNGELNLNNTLVYPLGIVKEDVLECTTIGNFKEGQIFFDKEQGQLSIWDGTSWKSRANYKVVDNKLNETLDGGKTWTPVSDYISANFRWSPENTIQINRTGKEEDWEDLSYKFANNVFIKGYVASYSALPSNPFLGDIYMVGAGAPYTMYVYTSDGWVDNGSYTSIAAGVVQTTGQSTTEVMSQKAVTEKLTELSSYTGNNDVNNSSLKQGFNFFRIDIKAGNKYLVKNNGSVYIAVRSTNEEKFDHAFIEEWGVSANSELLITPSSDATYLKVYTPSATIGFSFSNMQGNKALRESVDDLSAGIQSAQSGIETNKGAIASIQKDVESISKIVIGNVNLANAERLNAFIERYQTDMYWQQKDGTSCIKIEVKKGDRYTIIADTTKAYYALTDKLDYTTSYKAISLIDAIGGSINPNAEIVIEIPSDGYLLLSAIDNKGENRTPKSAQKYLGEIKSAIDESIADLAEEMGRKIDSEIDEVNKSIEDVSQEVSDKITNPSEGSNGDILMSLGNGKVKWTKLVPNTGKFYGYYTSESSLPSANEIGYAYVGNKAPFYIYNYDGAKWNNSGIQTYSEDATRINVRDFGAIGDGVTNDEDAIRAAFAYAVENLPCEVYFPKGDYGILNGGFPVKIPNGQGGLRISGDGGNLSRIIYLPDFEMTTGEGWYAIRIMPINTPTDASQYIHDVSIVGMGVYDTDPYNHALNPDATSGTKEETHGFDIQYAERAQVFDCCIDNVGDEAIDLYYVKDALISNNTIVGSPAIGSGGGAISVGDNSDRVVVVNNTIKGGEIDKNNFGISVESLYKPINNVVISNNVLSDINGTAIKFIATNTGAYIKNVVVQNNAIHKCTYGISDEGNMGKADILIGNNTLSEIADTAFFINKTSNNLVIENCIVDGANHAIFSVAEIIVKDSLFTNIRGYSVFASDNMTIDGCVFDKVSTDTTANAPVMQVYGEPSVSVKNCTIKNVYSQKGLQGIKYIANSEIMLSVVGDAIMGQLTEQVVNCRVNGRITIGKSNAIVRDVVLISDNIGSNAITLSANVTGASVMGCRIQIDNYNTIKENAGCNYNLICNNILNKEVSKVGANSVFSNNLICRITR